MTEEITVEVQNKRYLHAARTDDPELLAELLASGTPPDQNHADGLGNNALHYAAAHQSTRILEDILNLEIDVDFQNRMQMNTPLHEAVDIAIPQGPGGEQIEEVRNWIVNELLDAGADPRIPNKDGDKPVDLLSYGAKANTALGKELFDRLRKGEAEAGIDASDIANDDDEEGSEGTPSDEE